jgi:hypothetical protein
VDDDDVDPKQNAFSQSKRGLIIIARPAPAKPDLDDDYIKNLRHTTMDQTSMDAGNQSFPLQGVVACLSGINHDEKERLHDLVESLGGR